MYMISVQVLGHKNVLHMFALNVHMFALNVHCNLSVIVSRISLLFNDRMIYIRKSNASY